MSFPDIREEDIAAVAEVLRSGRLSLGPRAEEFGRKLAERCGVRHGIPVSSGTAALHLIVRALGLGRGDDVLVPSFTFAASVNALLYEGVLPVFVDIEPDTYNLSPADLERKRTDRTKAVMAVDVFGHPVEWDELLAFARRHRLAVIDDSCEALGATYRGRPLGSFGNAAAFAFYPNKQLTTGEGGLVATDDDEIARLARSMSNQGRAEMGAWVDHERLGYNYRLDEMSAALGLSQLGRLDELLAARERVARAYGERLAGLSRVSPPRVRPHVGMSWFVYVVTLAAGLDRDVVMPQMEAEGIPVRAYFKPLHRMPYVQERLGTSEFDLPVTDSVASRTMALPFHGGLTDAQIDRVVGTLAAVLGRVN